MTEAAAFERAPLIEGARRPRGRLLPVLGLSFLAHLIVIALFVLDGRPRPAPPLEVPVELVQAMPPAPKPAEKAASHAPQTKPQPAAPPSKPSPPPQPKPPQPKPPVQPKPPAQPKPPQPKPPQPAERPRPVAKSPQQSESVEQRMDRLLGSNSAMPAVALPGLAADGEEVVSYKQVVLSQVAKAKKVGRYKGVPGVAGVAFTVGDDGTLVRCEIVRKSVDPALDAEALAMVRRAAPFPPPPPGARRDYVIGLRFEAM